jgi:hypothetical protein
MAQFESRGPQTATWTLFARGSAVLWEKERKKKVVNWSGHWWRRKTSLFSWWSFDWEWGVVQVVFGTSFISFPRWGGRGVSIHFSIWPTYSVEHLESNPSLYIECSTVQDSFYCVKLLICFFFFYNAWNQLSYFLLRIKYITARSRNIGQCP